MRIPTIDEAVDPKLDGMVQVGGQTDRCVCPRADAASPVSRPECLC